MLSNEALTEHHSFCSEEQVQAQDGAQNGFAAGSPRFTVSELDSVLNRATAVAASVLACCAGYFD